MKGLMGKIASTLKFCQNWFIGKSRTWPGFKILFIATKSKLTNRFMSDNFISCTVAQYRHNNTDPHALFHRSAIKTASLLVMPSLLLSFAPSNEAWQV